MIKIFHNIIRLYFYDKLCSRMLSGEAWSVIVLTSALFTCLHPKKNERNLNTIAQVPYSGCYNLGTHWGKGLPFSLNLFFFVFFSYKIFKSCFHLPNPCQILPTSIHPTLCSFYFLKKEGRKKTQKITNGTNQKEVGRRDKEESQRKHKVSRPPKKTKW